MSQGRKVRRTSVTKFIPQNDREIALASFWYFKGRAEAELEHSAAFKKAAKRKVKVVIA